MKRILAKKNRENEAKQKHDAEEVARLKERMARLKRERLKKQQRLQDDEFDDIMGIPKKKPERKQKKKDDEQETFAFLDDNLGEGVASLLETSKATGGDQAESIGANASSESQARIDADLI